MERRISEHKSPISPLLIRSRRISFPRRRSRSRIRTPVRRRSQSRTRTPVRRSRSRSRIPIVFQDEQKERIYCGNSNILPPGYDRFGTRFQCLRKGYGAALLAPEYKRREALIKFRQRGYRRLSHEQLFNLASLIGIDTIRPNGTFKTQLQLLDEIIPVIRAMAL